MGLEKFRKQDNFVFEIEGEKFSIILPTRWNKEYSRAWQDFVAANGEVKDGKYQFGSMNPLSLVDAQKDAFAAFCIASGPLSGDELKDEYPALLDALFNKAVELAEAEESRADALVGKLLPTSRGRANGAGNMNSTKSSKEQEGSQRMM
jgi:hypothetical protein